MRGAVSFAFKWIFLMSVMKGNGFSLVQKVSQSFAMQRERLGVARLRSSSELLGAFRIATLIRAWATFPTDIIL
jgi:hypothetical protein